MSISERENFMLMLDGKQPEWVPNFGVACAIISPPILNRIKDPKTGYLVDRFGVEFTASIDGPIPVHTSTRQFTMTDVTKWRDYMPKIDYNTINWEDQIKLSIKNSTGLYGAPTQSDKSYCMFLGYIWDQLHYMMGFEQALLALAEEPEAVYDFFMAMADMYVEVLHHYTKYFKPDLITIMDHIANAKGLMMAPNTYREIIKPAQKKVFDAVLNISGMRAQMHVDGCVEDVIADYDEIGVTVIQPFQVFNDIEAAKKKYGMICIGGWDAFGPGNADDALEEEVRKSVRMAMDKYAPSGRYAFWASGASTRTPEKVDWLNDEAKIYGKKFYKCK